MEKIDEICAFKKEDALDTLDRTIGFINNCDNKTSIILGINGVMITILLSNEGVIELKNIMKSAITEGTVFSAIYLIILFLALAKLFYGIFKLLMVLFANTDCGDINQEDLECDSKIFFGSICKNSEFKQYKEKLLNLTEEDYMNDIISQIYINSVICNKKFDNYKVGMKASIIGFLSFVFIWGLGVIIY